MSGWLLLSRPPWPGQWGFHPARHLRSKRSPSRAQILEWKNGNALFGNRSQRAKSSCAGSSCSRCRRRWRSIKKDQGTDNQGNCGPEKSDCKRSLRPTGSRNWTDANGGRRSPSSSLELLRTWGLPRLSLWRLKRCRRSPCFTSHSPRSCKHGCQCRYWHRSSATCPDKRMCPASAQSSTRCATFIPDPAKFVLSLTSVTHLTGRCEPPSAIEYADDLARSC